MRSLVEAFRALPDYRQVKITKNHPGEILLLSLMAILSGAEGFADMAEWMHLRKREIERFWLKSTVIISNKVNFLSFPPSSVGTR
jgi:hypothetical protein